MSPRDVSAVSTVAGESTTGLGASATGIGAGSITGGGGALTAGTAGVVSIGAMSTTTGAGGGAAAGGGGGGGGASTGAGGGGAAGAGAAALAVVTGVPSAVCPATWVPAPLSATGGGTMTGGFAGSWPGVAGWAGTFWNGVPSGSVRSSGGVLMVPSGLTSGLAPAPDAGGWPGGVAAGPDWVPGRPWTWPLGGVPGWV